MFEQGWIKELLIVLAIAEIVVPLLGRFRIGSVPAFLIAGAIIGPGGLGGFVPVTPWLSWIAISDPERVLPFADLGVLFLLFLIGLDFSAIHLRAMRRFVFGVGPVQVVVSAAAIILTALVIGIDAIAAVVLGLALALSSTAVVTQTLIEARRFALPVGRLSLGVLVFQDLMVVPILIAVGLLAGDRVAPLGLLRGIALAIGAVVVILVAGRYLLSPLNSRCRCHPQP